VLSINIVEYNQTLNTLFSVVIKAFTYHIYNICLGELRFSLKWLTLLPLSHGNGIRKAIGRQYVKVDSQKCGKLGSMLFFYFTLWPSHRLNSLGPWKQFQMVGEVLLWWNSRRTFKFREWTEGSQCEVSITFVTCFRFG
jgi:hypothetical protein